MPDNPSTGQPVGDSSGDVPAEGSIDDILAGAAELAAGLKQEVGAPPPAGVRSSTASDPLAQGSADRATVDAQLDEIESLLDSAGEDLGADAAEDGTATLSQPSVSAQQEDAYHAEPSATQAPSPSGSDADDAGMLAAQGLAESESTHGDSPDDDGLQLLDDSLDDADGQAQNLSMDAAFGASATALTDNDRDWSGPANRGPSVLCWTLDRAVDLLDLFDRPFVWVGYDARRVVGWVALATIFAALCILIASHIQ